MQKIVKNKGVLQSQEGTHDEHRKIALDSVKDAVITQPDLRTDSMDVHRGDKPPRLKRPPVR